MASMSLIAYRVRKSPILFIVVPIFVLFCVFQLVFSSGNNVLGLSDDIMNHQWADQSEKTFYFPYTKKYKMPKYSYKKVSSWLFNDKVDDLIPEGHIAHYDLNNFEIYQQCLSKQGKSIDFDSNADFPSTVLE